MMSIESECNVPLLLVLGGVDDDFLPIMNLNAKTRLTMHTQPP